MRLSTTGTVTGRPVHSGIVRSSKQLLGVVVGLAVLFLALPLTSAAGAARATTAHAVSTSSSSKKKTSKKRRKSSRQSTQKAPTPDRITEIQSALARGGYLEGDPNGKWDSNTVAAMQKFQSSNGLEVNGKLDALSLQKLGLGSDIAGVSAPKPVTPHGSASLNTSPTVPLPSSGATAGPSASIASAAQPASPGTPGTANLHGNRSAAISTVASQ
jgi:peptidoglycan hydrolase-like protein with peptidoglycan-binding domain